MVDITSTKRAEWQAAIDRAIANKSWALASQMQEDGPDPNLNYTVFWQESDERSHSNSLPKM